MKKLTANDLNLIYRIITKSITTSKPGSDFHEYENNTPACEMILALYYWNLIPVNKKLLSICLNTQEDQWDKFFNFAADKWQEKADSEIEKLVN